MHGENLKLVYFTDIRYGLGSQTQQIILII